MMPVYNPQANDNEAQSAAWAVQSINSMPCTTNINTELNNHIIATQHHTIAKDDFDGQLLLDIDLAILGKNRLALMNMNNKSAKNMRGSANKIIV